MTWSLTVSLIAVLAAPPPTAPETPGPKRRFVYAGDVDFAPYEFFDAAGQPTGFNVELVRALARDAGVDVAIRLGPWDRERADFDAGKVDLVSVSYAEDRAQTYAWLGQTWTIHHCVLFPAGRATYPRGPNELAGEVIAVQERTGVEDILFVLPPPRPTLISTGSQTESLRLLFDHAATGVAGNSLTLRLAAAKAGVHNLVELPLRAVPYGLMAAKGREAEFAWVGTSLARLRAAGTIEALAERFLSVPPPARSGRDYAVFLAALALVVGAVSAGAVAWNRSLRRKVKLRTRELEETLGQREKLARSLTESEERYRTFLALSSEGIARFDLDPPLAIDRPEAEQIDHILKSSRLSECNAAFLRMMRRPAGESLTGLLLTDLAPATELAEGVRAFLRGAYRLEANESLRNRPDGTAMWITANAVGIVDGGLLRSIWLTQQEVTARKLAEEALRASEKKFRDIFDFAPIGIYQTVADGTIVTANKRFATILGYEGADDVLGLNSARDMYANAEERGRNVARIDAEGHLAHAEGLLKRRDGTTFWGEGAAHTVKDADGRTLYYESFLLDASVRKAAEEALRASEERYRLLFDGNPLPMLVYDLESLRFVAVNEAAVAQYGYSRGELLGLTVSDVAVPGDENLARFLETRFDPRPAILRVGLRQQRRKDGSTIDVDLTSLALRFGGRPARLILARDVTAERQVEAERERLRESLRRSETMAAMGSLVAGVAHEVRNPLFSISATVDALESETAGRQEYADYTTLLRSQVGRLTQLMHDLLDYGKPPVLKTARTRPAEVLHRALRSCGRLARERGVALEEHSAPDLPDLVLDAGRMEQVFENLLANAIQHSPPGTTVTAWAEKRDGVDPALEFRVEDEGSGLAPDDIPRLFEPFFSRRRGGTGLGLSVVQRIVDAHGGRVAAANRERGGAVFTVRLPLAPASEAEARRA